MNTERETAVVDLEVRTARLDDLAEHLKLELAST